MCSYDLYKPQLQPLTTITNKADFSHEPFNLTCNYLTLYIAQNLKLLTTNGDLRNGKVFIFTHDSKPNNQNDIK